MNPDIKKHKKRFDRELRHIKLTLMQQRQEMPVHDWLQLVQQTKESILTHPDEYFCGDVPPKPVFQEAIDKVFDGFLTDQRLLALQKSKGFRIPSMFTKSGTGDHHSGK